MEEEKILKEIEAKRKDRLDELRWDSIKEIRNTQVKYIYYVIALNVAGVAFSMNQVKDQQFNWSHFLLAIALAFWAFGVFFGFKFLEKFKRTLHQSQNYFQFALEFYKMDEAKKKAVMSDFNQGTTQTQLEGDKIYKRSLIFFYFGCVLFVAWQALQMIFFNRVF